ncbi:XdhC family protein [Williamsia sp. SKLECPSW1]
MPDVSADILAAWRAGEVCAVATVVRATRSAPCPPGTTMALLPDGSITGSVSGGCVEADVVECMRDVLAGASPSVHRYDAGDDLVAVGLPCGGTLDVFVTAVSQAAAPHLTTVADDRAAGRAVATATVVDHPDPDQVGTTLVVRDIGIVGTLGSPRLDRVIGQTARTMLDTRNPGVVDVRPDGRPGVGVSVFVDVHPPRPRMLVYGAAVVAAAVAEQGSFLGHRVTVCDHRAEFATARRFPAADEVVVARPADHLSTELAAGTVDDRTVVCALTHDLRVDVDLLEVALRARRLGYVGAIGSRQVHDERTRRLRGRGLTASQLARLCSPIGLDLGARTPAEVALAVAAEITARRHAASGLPLSSTRGPVHGSVVSPSEQSA